MNKQIKELAQRAEALTEQEWHRLAQSTDGMPAYRDLFNQMFAELIVRECIGMVLPYNEEDPCAERLYELADTIGEHFGVEL